MSISKRPVIFVALVVIVAALTVGAPIAGADPWFNDRSSAIRPDDRAGTRGPGAWASSGAAQRVARPDDRAGARGPGAVASARATPAATRPDDRAGARGTWCAVAWDLHHRRPLGEHVRLGRRGDRGCQWHGLCPSSGRTGSSDGRDANEDAVVALSDSDPVERRGPHLRPSSVGPSVLEAVSIGYSVPTPRAWPPSRERTSTSSSRSASRVRAKGSRPASPTLCHRRAPRLGHPRRGGHTSNGLGSSQRHRLVAGQQRVSELPKTAGNSGNRRDSALAQPSRTGTVGNGSGVLAMQKVEGSSPFIRFEFKPFRAGDAGNRAPVMPQTDGAGPA